MLATLTKLFLLLGAVNAAVIDSPIDDGVDSFSNVMANCTYANCVSFCESIGYITGNCIGNSCICVLPRDGKESKDMPSDIVEASVTLKTCDGTKCNQICQLLGFNRGTCFGDTCECFRLQEHAEQSLKSCNFNQCDQQCRRMGFPGGACVGDRCKCDIILNIQAVIEPRSHGIHFVQDCEPLTCFMGCRNKSHKGGGCVNGRCVCDYMQRLKELMGYAVHGSPSCVHSHCHDACRRKQHDSGVCVGSRCKCDTLFPVEDNEIPSDY